MSDYRNIQTCRFDLHPICINDLEDIWPHVSNPEICRDMSWEPHAEKTETESFLRNLEANWKSDRGYTWSIREIRSQVFCGIFSLIDVRRSHRALTYDRAELAYWCATAWQRKGVMTEVGNAVTAVAFQSLDIHRLVVSHHENNFASERLITRLGFQRIGREREAFAKDGYWINTIFYDMLKSDFDGTRLP